VNPRSKEIYVSDKTMRRLFRILKIEKEKVKGVTIDEIADRLLNEKIEHDYPNIAVLEKRMDALEDQFTTELLNPPPEK
jgi:hypothetical protein